ncbi:MAG: hypothetical protein K940chlam8_00476 [Chlamydiae bacterium]|nr:hypothetical protein [Chlamydiota bacterium]
MATRVIFSPPTSFSLPEKFLGQISQEFYVQFKQTVFFDLCSGIYFDFPNKQDLEIQLEETLFQIKFDPKTQVILNQIMFFKAALYFSTSSYCKLFLFTIMYYLHRHSNLQCPYFDTLKSDFLTDFHNIPVQQLEKLFDSPVQLTSQDPQEVYLALYALLMYQTNYPSSRVNAWTCNILEQCVQLDPHNNSLKHLLLMTYLRIIHPQKALYGFRGDCVYGAHYIPETQECLTYSKCASTLADTFDLCCEGIQHTVHSLYVDYHLRHFTPNFTPQRNRKNPTQEWFDFDDFLYWVPPKEIFKNFLDKVVQAKAFVKSHPTDATKYPYLFSPFFLNHLEAKLYICMKEFGTAEEKIIALKRARCLHRFSNIEELEQFNAYIDPYINDLNTFFELACTTFRDSIIG